MEAPFHPWHLMPKWLLPFTASWLRPAPLSRIPCAKVMLAGTFHFSICPMAQSLYWSMYCWYAAFQVDFWAREVERDRKRAVSRSGILNGEWVLDGMVRLVLYKK